MGELDKDFGDLVGLLNFDKPKEEPPKKGVKDAKKDELQSFESIAHMLRNDATEKAQPLKNSLTEKEKAAQRKAKLV